MPGDRSAEQPLVTNMFYQTSLIQALSDIAAQTGVIIVPDMSVQGLVTCELQDVPLDQALEIVLSVGNFEFRHMDGYILIGSGDRTSPSFLRLSETEMIKLGYVDAEGAVQMLAEPLRVLAKANASTNTVSVTAPPNLMRRVLEDLRKLDRPPRHVMLDARVVVMEQGRLQNLGLQWDWPQLRAGAYANAEGGTEGKQLGGIRWPWGIQIGYTPGREFTDALLLSLNLMSQNDEAAVIATPQVMAQDGKEAQISVSTDEYFEILTQGYYTRSQLEKIEVGTVLTLMPRVGQNGDITLQMTAEVSDVVARGANNLPVVTRRTAQSTVRVQDGGTAVVAGLMDHRAQFNRSGIPLLSWIPVLGRLFGNDLQGMSSRQVAVFVTAWFVSDGTPDSADASVERPTIPRAGKEFRKALEEVLSRTNEGGPRW